MMPIQSQSRCCINNAAENNPGCGLAVAKAAAKQTVAVNERVAALLHSASRFLKECRLFTIVIMAVLIVGAVCCFPFGAYASESHWMEWCPIVDENGELDVENAECQFGIPGVWNKVSSFSDGLAYVEKDGEYGFINTQGELAIPYQWDDVESFSEGLAAVQKSYFST